MGNDLILPSGEDLSPAMKVLTEKQRRFVLAYLTTITGNSRGTPDQTEAARLAGYGSEGSPGSCAVRAHELMHMPKIVAAIREMVEIGFIGDLVVGRWVLRDLALNSNSDAVKKAAASELLNRGGLLEKLGVVQHDHNVKFDRKELIGYIDEAAKRIGGPTQALLEKIVDAEFEEVDPFEFPPET